MIDTTQIPWYVACAHPVKGSKDIVRIDERSKPESVDFILNHPHFLDVFFL